MREQSKRLVHLIDRVQTDILRNQRRVVHVQELVQAQLVLHFEVSDCITQSGVLAQHNLTGLNNILVRNVLR